MDVVRSNIEQINGTVDIESKVGQGSQFLIKIPLTLAIVSALVIGSAGERFAIPQISVVEIVLPGAQPDMVLDTIDGAPVLRLRNRLLPLVSLTRTLRLHTEADPSGDAACLAEKVVVVLTVGSQRLGLIVEHVFDTEEIVVKPVAPVIRNIPAVLRQHHPRRRCGHHDPRSARHRPGERSRHGDGDTQPFGRYRHRRQRRPQRPAAGTRRTRCAEGAASGADRAPGNGATRPASRRPDPGW